MTSLPGEHMNAIRQYALSVLAGLFLLAPGFSLAQEATPGCTEHPNMSHLDFWVGHWAVYKDEKRVGASHIEKTLNDCAVLEHWTSKEGGQGKSLFYFDAQNGRWKQVWVTEHALRTGGVKEKAQVKNVPPPAMRFQGHIAHGEGQSYLDRTTLIPNKNGTVRQLIEISKDEGETWETTFDAVYMRLD